MSRPRILIVDDEQHIVSLLSMTLRKEGYEIVSASNGEKALALLGAFEFDLVITDHTMPGMDGLELSNRIDESIPVLMITSRPQILKERAHRIADVIHKPFSPREVSAKVQDVIGPGQQPKEQSA
jgi:two-component system alkaline phosphatase synthesis response regulator PhoP